MKLFSLHNLTPLSLHKLCYATFSRISLNLRDRGQKSRIDPVGGNLCGGTSVEDRGGIIQPSHETAPLSDAPCSPSHEPLATCTTAHEAPSPVAAPYTAGICPTRPSPVNAPSSCNSSIAFSLSQGCSRSRRSLRALLNFAKVPQNARKSGRIPENTGSCRRRVTFCEVLRGLNFFWGEITSGLGVLLDRVRYKSGENEAFYRVYTNLGAI